MAYETDAAVGQASEARRARQLASALLALAAYNKPQAQAKAREFFPDLTWDDVVKLSVEHMQAARGH